MLKHICCEMKILGFLKSKKRHFDDFGLRFDLKIFYLRLSSKAVEVLPG